jgi:hypothetical protein
MNSDHDTLLRGWVAPFGDPGITDRSHLPRAFRSVPRPSSPLSAKASTRCPCLSLDPRRRGRTCPRGPTQSRHPGKPPRTGASPNSRRLHVKTLFRTAPHPGIAPGASGPVRLGHIHKFTLPFNQHPPPPRRRRRTPVRPAAPHPGTMPWSSPNAGPGDQEPGVRTPRSGRSSDLCRRSSDPVEVNGIEPMTSCLQSRRSPN